MIFSLPVLIVADAPTVAVADYSADTVDYSTKFPVLPAATSPFTFALCSACTELKTLSIEVISVEDTFMLPLSTDFLILSVNDTAESIMVKVTEASFNLIVV